MKLNDRYESKCYQYGNERTYGRSVEVKEKEVVKIISIESKWVTLEKEYNGEYVDMPIQQFLLTFNEVQEFSTRTIFRACRIDK